MAVEKSKPPIFSIITVCYNASKTIERTVQSVLNQTFTDFEYIIIDGASKDATLDVLEPYRDRIKTLISEPDEGIYHAMNKGIDLAKGELVGIINSDDWYEPDTLKQVYDAWKQSDKKTIFHGLCRYFVNGREGKILSYHHDILPQANIAHPTCFVPLELYQEHGKYDPKYSIAADYELLLRYYLLGVPFRRIEKVLANFSDGGISETGNSALEVLKIRRQHGQISRKGYLLNRIRQRINIPFL